MSETKAFEGPVLSTRCHYIQQYDERGHPTHPTSRELGRQIRQAQNDVLAAIGVVERTTLREQEDQSNPRDENAIIESVQDEILIGNICIFGSSFVRWLCSFWIDNIRSQLLVIPALSEAPLSRIISVQCKFFGYTRFMLSGLLNAALGELTAGVIVHFVPWSRLVDQVVIWLRLPRKARKTIQRYKPWMKEVSVFLVTALVSPFTCYSILQGTRTAHFTSVLPPIRAFWPNSESSPIHRTLSSARHLGAVGRAMTLILSPFVLIRLGNYVYDEIETYFHGLLDRAILQPSNPDKYSSLRERHRFGTPQHTTLGCILTAIGWGHRSRPAGEEQKADLNLPLQENSHNAEDSAVNNVVPNEPTPGPDQRVNTLSEPEGRMHEMASNRHAPASEPDSPTGLRSDAEGAEPTIFIRSRDESANGMEVEMEIVLPQNTREGGGGEAHPIASTRRLQKRHRVEPVHRVTELSVAPANILASLFSRQAAIWVTLPLHALVTRTIVSEYTSGLRENWALPAGGHITVWNPVGSPFPWRSKNQWANGGLLLGKLALCSMVELAIGLGLWHFHCFGAWYVGRTTFDWGKL